MSINQKQKQCNACLMSVEINVAFCPHCGSCFADNSMDGTKRTNNNRACQTSFIYYFEKNEKKKQWMEHFCQVDSLENLIPLLVFHRQVGNKKRYLNFIIKTLCTMHSLEKTQFTHESIKILKDPPQANEKDLDGFINYWGLRVNYFQFLLIPIDQIWKVEPNNNRAGFNDYNYRLEQKFIQGVLALISPVMVENSTLVRKRKSNTQKQPVVHVTNNYYQYNDNRALNNTTCNTDSRSLNNFNDSKPINHSNSVPIANTPYNNNNNNSNDHAIQYQQPQLAQSPFNQTPPEFSQLFQQQPTSLTIGSSSSQMNNNNALVDYQQPTKKRRIQEINDNDGAMVDYNYTQQQQLANYSSNGFSQSPQLVNPYNNNSMYPALEGLSATSNAIQQQQQHGGALVPSFRQHPHYQ